MNEKEFELLKKIKASNIDEDTKIDLFNNLTNERSTEYYKLEVQKRKDEGYIIARENRYDTDAKIWNYKTNQKFSFKDAKKLLPSTFLIKWRNINDNELYMKSMRPDMPQGEFTDEKNTKCWNTYTGWNIKPCKKEWKHIEDYLFRLICNKNEENYKYLLKWLSKIISHPETKSGIALALTGTQGSGKNTLYYLLKMIMGEEYCYTSSNPMDIKKEFNGWIQNKILCFFDEADLDIPEYNKIKPWITEPEISIRLMRENAEKERNYTNFMLATNKHKFLPVEKRERRWFVLEMSNEEAGKLKEYWKPFYDNFIKDEIEGFMNYLIELDIERLEEPPMTEAKLEQQEMAQSQVIEWWYDFINTDIFKDSIKTRDNNCILKCSIAHYHYSNIIGNEKLHIRSFISEIKRNALVNTISISHALYFILDKNNINNVIYDEDVRINEDKYSGRNNDSNFNSVIENSSPIPLSSSTNDLETEINKMINNESEKMISNSEMAEFFPEHKDIWL